MNLCQQLDHAKPASDESAVEACIVRLRQQREGESKLLLNLASAWLMTRRGDLASYVEHSTAYHTIDKELRGR